MIEHARILPPLEDVKIKEHFTLVVGDSIIRKYGSPKGSVKDDMMTSGWQWVETGIVPGGGAREVNNAIVGWLKHWGVSSPNELWERMKI